MSYAGDALAGMRSAYWKFMRENPSTLKAVVALNGVGDIPMPKVYPTPQKYPKETYKKGIEMLKAGKRSSDIAKELNVHPVAVGNWKRRAGLCQPRFKWSAEKKAEVLNLCIKGFSAKQVERMTGVPENTVMQMRLNNGIPTYHEMRRRQKLNQNQTNE